MDDSKVRTPRVGRGAGRGKDGRPTNGPGGGPAQMGNALEALRVTSTYLVVLYHVALTYMSGPMRLTLWLAVDSSGHVAFDYFVYWVNGFVMPVFFLAAGVSAPAACEARGARVFLTSRARRLLRPLLFGCLTILPFTYVLWGYGLMVTGRCDLNSIMRWRFNPEVSHNLYGVLHLWFLEYLFVVCVLWCGGWSLRRYLARGAEPSTAGADDGRIARVLASPWRPVLLAVPTALIFLVDSDTMLRVDNVFIPNLFRLVHYTYFFAVGGWIARTRDPRQRFIPYSTFYLVLSFVLFAAMSPLLLRHASAPLVGGERVVYCLLAALFPWLVILGGLGVFLRVLDGRGTVMRYLAESSMWVYIGHLPIVALMQVVLLPLALPGVVKFLMGAVVAIGLSLLSYEYIVRRSLIGEIINGSRKRTTKRGWFGPEFGWVATAGVLSLMVAGMLWYSKGFLFGNNLHEEIPGRFYRSARLSTRDLDGLIRSKGLRTVITFTSGSILHPWYVDQGRVCRAHRVELHPVNLSAERLPTRETLNQLIDLLERSPRPILVQGNRGLDQSGFAAAVAQLLDGAPPSEALRQFAMRYGQFGGAEHSLLGQTLLDYQGWLASHQWAHSAERFRAWVDREYPTHSIPAQPGEALADRQREPVLSR